MAGSKGAKVEKVRGKFGTYVIKKERLGGGGNGEVFAIDIQDKTDLAVSLDAFDGYVLKKLKIRKNDTADDRAKREKRFQREITVVSNKLKDIDGIIPILDSSFENTNFACPYQ